jgi:tetratricopeptide (TPR) repeat protein
MGKILHRLAAVLAIVSTVETTDGWALARWRQSDANQQGSVAKFRELAATTKNRLRDQPAGHATDEQILKPAFEQLDRLSHELVKISATDRKSAQMLSELGDVSLELRAAIENWQRNPPSELANRIHANATDLVQRFFQRAIDILQAHLGASVDAKRALASCYEKLGKFHIERRSEDQALEACRSSVRLRRSICDGDPNNTQAQRELGEAYVQLGTAEARKLHLNEANEAYHQNLAIQNRLASADPKSARTRHDLAVAYQKVADGYLFIQSVDEAIDACQSGLQCLGHASELVNDVPRPGRGPTGADERRQNSGARSAPKSRTLELMLLTAELSAAIADAEGSNSDSRAAAAQDCDNAGALALMSGAYPAAARSFQKAVDLIEPIAKAEPNHLYLQRQLTYDYRMLEDAHSQMGELPKALAATRKGLQTAQSLFKFDPRDVQNLDHLSTLFVDMGTIVFRQGDREAALRAYRQSVEPAENALKANPADSSIKQALENALEYRGQASEKIGWFVEARDCYGKALATNPDSLAARVYLATLLAACPMNPIRDGKRAVKLAAEACKLMEQRDPDCLEAGAAACAEVGRFDIAIKTQKAAIEVNRDPKSKDRLVNRLKLYEAHKPYRLPWSGAAPGTENSR